MQINIEGLRQVQPKVNQVRGHLMKAKGTVRRMKVPGDIKQAGQLKTVPSRIQTITSSLSSIGEWVESSISEFEEASRKEKEIVNALNGIYSIRKNYNIKC